MKKRLLLMVCAVLLFANYTSTVNGYWPIVFQMAKEGRAYESVKGPVRFMNGGVGVDPNSTPAGTSVSYSFAFREFNSLREEVLKSVEVYLQIYPLDVRSYYYGKIGYVWFNGGMTRKFNMTQEHFSLDQTYFTDESGSETGQTRLGFPIPLYNYYSNQSLFVNVPRQLLRPDINVTFSVDAGVFWKIYIISVIVRVPSDSVAPWWQRNLPVVLSVALMDVVGLALVSVKLRQRLRRGGVIN